MRTVHLNNAGAGLMPSEVVDTMIDYLHREARDGSYECEHVFSEVVEDEVYRLIGQLLGAEHTDVALFGSATTAWLAAAQTVPLVAGDEVWVTPYEYAGNLIVLSRMRHRFDVTIRTVPLHANGDLNLEWFAANLSERCALVSVPHVPSGCGIVNPVEQIGQLLGGHRALYFVDGCQAVGQIDVDVGRIGCDLYTGAGRKFLRGPRGTGFSYTHARLRDSAALSFHDLHVASVGAAPHATVTVDTDSARIWETAERSTVATVGLAEALRHHFAAGAAPYDRALSQRLRTRLTDIVGPSRLVDPGEVLSNMVTVDTHPVPAGEVVSRLRQDGFNTWVMNGPDTPTYMAMRRIVSAVRVSPHYFVTPSQIDDFAVAFERCLTTLR